MEILTSLKNVHGPLKIQAFWHSTHLFFPTPLTKDTLGGHFDASQALVGELSQFNLWDRVLKPAEVAALAECSSSALGNIAPWTDLDVDVYGGATKESLDPCHAAQRSSPPSSKQWKVTEGGQLIMVVFHRSV